MSHPVRKRTTTRTFRIGAEWDNVLQQEAARQGLSVNVLMNKILSRYVLFDRWAERYGAIALVPRAFQGILGTTTQEDLAKAGEESGKDIINILDEMGLALTLDSFVYFIEEFLGKGKRWFHVSHYVQGNEDLFHFQHDLGKGWSVYLSEYLKPFLKSLNNIDPEIRIYEYAVNLKVKRSNPKPKI